MNKPCDAMEGKVMAAYFRWGREIVRAFLMDEEKAIANGEGSKVLHLAPGPEKPQLAAIVEEYQAEKN